MDTIDPNPGGLPLAEFKASEIAHLLGARLEGEDCVITGVAGIEEAGPGHLTFVANPKYAPAARTTGASAIIVSGDFPAIPIPTLRCSNPYLAFARSVELFYKPPVYVPGVHPTAVVHDSARIGRNASIGPYVVIDQDVVIGDDCVLLPHAVIYRGARIGNRFLAHAHAVVREFCQLGDDVILQNGAIVGADGFGFAKDDQGSWHKIVQSGPAVLEDQVEVQANACVDRASIGETRVAKGAKLDNMVQVGHGSSVGQDTLLCAHVGLAGSTHVGNKVILAGQVGIAGHCKIGDGVIATGQSGLHGDIPPGSVMSGSPAIDSRQWMRCIAAFNRLPELARVVRSMAAESDGNPDAPRRSSSRGKKAGIQQESGD
jgi:UDP-3-O-[3-hydroxymyristoyl] glucosamine N-acyltransferase